MKCFSSTGATAGFKLLNIMKGSDRSFYTRLRLQVRVTVTAQERPHSGGSGPGFAAAPDAPLAVPRAVASAHRREAPIPPRRLAARPSHPRRRTEARGSRKIVRSGVIRTRGRGAGGPYKHRAEGCVAQLALGEVCGVGSVEQCRGENSAGRGPRHELGIRAEGRGVCTEELRPGAMADSDGGGRAGTLPSLSTAAPRGGGGEGPGRASTGKMAAAQAQRCFKMVACARRGREGEAREGSAFPCVWAGPAL